MHAVANAQDGQATCQNRLIDVGRVFIVDAGWTTRENNALDVQVSFLLKLRERSCGGQEFAIDMTLTHATGNQPAVLGTIVEDDDRLSTLQGLHKIFSPEYMNFLCAAKAGPSLYFTI